MLPDDILPHDILIVTRTAHPGMVVRDVFRECLSARVQALPYRDESGLITGRVTLKYIVNHSVVPAYVAELAHVIGDDHATFEEMERRLPAIFDRGVEEYVQEPHASIHSDTQLMKALAVMEHHDTSYLFVVDEGVYRGTITIQGIAAWMVHFDGGA